MSLYDTTIDWDAYWETADEDDTAAASPSEMHLLDPLVEFLEATDRPDSYADVGCGAGVVPFEVADRYSAVTVVGYDAAEAVLADNRERARSEGLDVEFERTVLPEFDPGRQFGVVSAFYTLCYVEDVAAALEALYDAVEPGGYLVLTYHNRYAQSVFEGIAEAPHEHLDGNSAWDPDTFAERFELVIEGENLLSYERIHDILGTWPQSVWSVTDEADRYPAWRHNPLVYVPK